MADKIRVLLTEEEVDSSWSIHSRSTKIMQARAFT